MLVIALFVVAPVFTGFIIAIERQSRALEKYAKTGYVSREVRELLLSVHGRCPYCGAVREEIQ